jgi:organic radical activating enzyme
MARSERRPLARGVGFEAEDEDIDLMHLRSVTGGEPRSGQLTGTKALMLAVLEDGIRSYLSGSKVIAQDAEYWICSHRRQSPFSFVVVCEMLGLDPDAVRKTLKRMKSEHVSARKALPRARHNVRIPGRVYTRRSG